MSRFDGRKVDELRPVRITPNFLKHPAGSCLIEVGNTKVICSAIVEETVPKWLKGSGQGWLTAEYGMLPGCSGNRINRERGKVGGRTQEIQRLIGRSLRTSLDLKVLGERAVLIDCDVMDADGGTRTAAITGAWVALKLAAQNLKETIPELDQALSKGHAVAAVSVGIIGGKPCLDLPYEEDKNADVDMNVVMTSENKYVEVQGTGEASAFDANELQSLLSLANGGLKQLFEFQQKALG